MRHSIAGNSTITSNAARPGVSLFSIAATGAKIREIGVFNRTSTAFTVGVARMTANTGVGAGLTEVDWDEASPAGCTGFAGNTSDGTLGSPFRQASVGAAVGSGVIFTFGDSGILIKVGLANGVGVYVPQGTGQLFDYYIDWDE